MTEDDKIVQFPQPPADEMSSIMALLECRACHKEWVGFYRSGARVGDLHCPYCEATDLISKRGEKEIFFYEHD